MNHTKALSRPTRNEDELGGALVEGREHGLYIISLATLQNAFSTPNWARITYNPDTALESNLSVV